jgi:hypothetical protein
MKWKAITPNLLVSDDWKFVVEKDDSEPDILVNVYFKEIKKSRLFCSEDEADDFIRYLTDDNF